MRQYRIWNIGHGFFAECPVLSAKSPAAAVKLLGYKNVRRIYDNHSPEVNLIVMADDGSGRTYLYHGEENYTG